MTATEKWRIPDSGLWGFSHCGFYDTWYPWSGMEYEGRLARLVEDMVEIGADSFRPQIHWHQVEPFLGAGLTGPGDVTEEIVENYAKGDDQVRWDLYDRLVDSLVEAGIEPHVVICAAYDFQVPASVAGRTCARAVPDCIGRDRYLGHIYLHARAAVRRYRDRVHIWQLENELNGAGETMLMAHWRTGRSWFDSGFLTAIMEVLSRAVREEDPTALTSHNFLTEVRIIRDFFDWRNDVRRWLPFLDIVGVDPYPNYLIGWPSRGRAVGKRVRQAVEVAEGRPVMVLESGYPVRPWYRGMSEARQAEYACDAPAAAVEAGACGFYYYELCSPEGYPVAGPWSDRYFQSIEPWWGLVRKDDTRRPAWFEYGKAMENARCACAARPGA
jgi:hypothetical protein